MGIESGRPRPGFGCLAKTWVKGAGWRKSLTLAQMAYIASIAAEKHRDVAEMASSMNMSFATCATRRA